MEGDHDTNLYKEHFDPNSNKDDLDLLGLGKDVDNRQEEVRLLKSRLEDWRPVSLHIVQFLQWKRPWYPAVLVASNSIFFLLVWYFSLSILSTLAILGMIVSFADGIVPILSSTIYDANSWSDEHEREYDALCNGLLDLKQMACNLLCNVQRLKSQLPRFFSLGLCGVCIVAAILFDKVNNFVLMYLLTNLLLLLPGLLAKNMHEVLRHHGAQLIEKIKNKKKQI